jgi:uncharacterized membrane protein YfcA
MADPGFSLIFFISIVAGFFGAMTGLGGGTIIVPALTFLGVDIKIAIAASMVSVIATSCSSAAAYIRQGMVNLKVGMFLEMFTILGAVIGASITLFSGQTILYIVFGLVLVGAGISLFAKQRLSPEPSSAGHQDRFSRWLGLTGSYEDRAEKRTITYYPTRAAIGGPLMVLAGIISGLLGIGAGAFKVLVQDLAMGLPTKVSTSTSNMIIGVTALAGSSVYLAAGLVDPVLAIPIILGVIVGALAGTLLLVRTSNQTVRNYFIVVVMIIGIDMMIRGMS